MHGKASREGKPTNKRIGMMVYGPEWGKHPVPSAVAGEEVGCGEREAKPCLHLDLSCYLNLSHITFGDLRKPSHHKNNVKYVQSM